MQEHPAVRLLALCAGGVALGSLITRGGSAVSAAASSTASGSASPPSSSSSSSSSSAAASGGAAAAAAGSAASGATADGEGVSVGSAPGKVILFGEHSVVYGRRAVATALGLRTWVVARDRVASGSSSPAVDAAVELCLHDLGVRVSWSEAELSLLGETHSKALERLAEGMTGGPADEEPNADLLGAIAGLNVAKLTAGGKGPSGEETVSESVAHGVAACLYLLMCVRAWKQGASGRGATRGAAACSLSVDIRSLLPVGTGLGSSAAYAVALVTAVFAHYGVCAPCECNAGGSSDGAAACAGSVDGLCAAQRRLVNGWAFQLEKVIHGTPSGIDNAVSTFGGVLAFDKGSGMRPLDDPPLLQLLLVNTRVPRSTRELVAGVRRRYDRNQEATEQILSELHTIAEKAVTSLSGGGGEASTAGELALHRELSELVVRAQELLDALGVSHPSLDIVCAAATAAGMAAKLTGAGGGGCAFILIPPGTTDTRALVDELQAVGCDVFAVDAAGRGAALHAVEDLPWPLDQEPN